jgi:hypothetical protein
MRPARRLGILLALLALCAITPASAAAGEATWQFAPAEAPPAPPGTPQQPLPVPLGKVGAISFWSPNRGLLIDEGTAGCRTTSTTGVPCGLYAYNGRGWHLLSTVCGAGEGRIAWAGPDNFWTISDQRPGQLTRSTSNPRNVSLCHFEKGKFVASYATPFDLPNSYLQMDAAACVSETDCWFAGLLGVPPNTGAFHLHWDGHNLTAVYSPWDHAITSMAVAGPGALFESVEINPTAIGDGYGGESEAHPFVLHQIDSNGEFHGVLMDDPSCAALKPCPPLPNYEGVAPPSIAGFSLSGDYSLAIANPEPQLWAAAGLPSRLQGNAHSIVLRYSQGGWSQVLDLNHPGTYATEGERREAQADLETGLREVAAEPGSPAAWATIGSGDGEAHVDRLSVESAATRTTNHTGTIEQKDVLGEAQHVGQLGSAGPIACPAKHDCWLATSKGWLFHLTEIPREADEPSAAAGYPEDTDQNFAGVIGFRPLDEGVPQLPPNEPPPDTSLANQLPAPLTPPKPATETPLFSQPTLIMGLHSRVVHGNTLELTFKLLATAHVQLVASRNGRRVAQTARETLKAGKRKLMLRLNPHRWPNKIDLKATPLHPLPPGPAISGGQTKSAPLTNNSFST